MPDHELPLVAFIAGDLDPTTAGAVDEHLLCCDRCWLAVREDRAGRTVASRLREPSDPKVADRIRMAVELAPAPRSARRRHLSRGHLTYNAVAAGALAVVLAALTLTLWPRHDAPGRDSAALGRIVALASNLPSAETQSGGRAVALEPRSITRAAGQVITVQTYAFDGGRALVATSTRPFRMPADAHMPTGAAMPWTVARGPVTVYCPHTDVLLAGPESANELAALARVLHLT